MCLWRVLADWLKFVNVEGFLEAECWPHRLVMTGTARWVGILDIVDDPASSARSRSRKHTGLDKKREEDGDFLIVEFSVPRGIRNCSAPKAHA